jgi:YHS domain-containing protein
MIMKLLIGIIAVYLLYKLFRKGFPQMAGKAGSTEIRTPVAGEDLVEDPICHTYIPVGHACRTEIEGKTVYFCSQKCLEQYNRER